jgi:hypothetical protein
MLRMPVIGCQSSLRTWYFYCPYCRCTHVHGPIAGHHAARCLPRVDSPYKETGYILAPSDRLARLRAASHARRTGAGSGDLKC